VQIAGTGELSTSRRNIDLRSKACIDFRELSIEKAKESLKDESKKN